MSLLRKMNIASDDSPSIDAFGRWRVSNPVTLFDSKNVFDNGLGTSAENQPLFFDNVQLSGTGTSTLWNVNNASQTLIVSANTYGTRVRQTKMRFNYQPGKSQMIIISFNLNGTQSGIVKREGIFDENDGIFLESSGTNLFIVNRSKSSGNIVENKILQSNWNLDTMDGNGVSKINLDFTKTQLLFVDYEWLGAGRVRVGFVVDGMIYYAHQFLNTNNLDKVYMSTPNLPLRAEITNIGSGTSASISQICSTVISEGGNDNLGVIRYASTDGSHVDCDVENTVYAILGISLKSTHLGQSVKLLNAALQVQTASHRIEWMLILNPTVAGTFNYVGENISSVEIARGSSTNTVSGGFKIAGGFIESGGAATGAAGSIDRGIDNAILLGSTVNGTRDTIVLCARPIGGSTGVDVEGSLLWRSLT